MTEDFGTCSICMESFDMKQRIPKSLQCRHYLCAPCLTSHLASQSSCPKCRKPIENTDDIANELAIIDYLQSQEEQTRKEQQKAMKEELQRLITSTEKEQERIEEKLKIFKNGKSKETKEKSRLYSTHVKYLLNKALDCCNSEANLSRIASKIEEEMENNLQEVRTCNVTMKTLLEKDFVAWEDFDNCKMAATRTRESNEDRMWEEYRERLLEQLTNISKEATKRHRDFNPGNITRLTAFLDYTFR